MWQEYSVLKAPDESDSPLYKIADPATDGPAPVSLLEAVMRAYPGLEDRAAPEVHLLRHREGDDREAEDIVYDLNTLTQANPPPLPECKPGDVLLLLPRVAKPPTSQQYQNSVVFEPLPRDLAVYLEEKQTLHVQVTAPASAPDYPGDWQIIRPLIGDPSNSMGIRTDFARRTAWTPSSLYYVRFGVFNFGNNSLKLSRITRAGGTPVLEITQESYAYPNSTQPIFLREGDQIEITASEPQPSGGRPRRAVVLPGQ